MTPVTLKSSSCRASRSLNHANASANPRKPAAKAMLPPCCVARARYSEERSVLVASMFAISIGKGNITVEFFSPAITFSVLR